MLSFCDSSIILCTTVKPFHIYFVIKHSRVLQKTENGIKRQVYVGGEIVLKSIYTFFLIMCLSTNFWKNSQPHGFAKECCSKTYSLSEELPYVCAYSYLYLCRMTNITCLHGPWRLCLPALFPEGVSTFYWLITILRIQSSLGQNAASSLTTDTASASCFMGLKVNF